MTDTVAALDLPGFAYGTTPVLGPVALRVARGEVLALTGASGIGKSTLLRILAGLSPAVGIRAVTPRIAFVFQEPVLLRWRTARRNVEIAAGVTPAAAQAALEDVGVGDLAARFPDQMSLGQQRRLTLARAFATAPDLMLLDEPFVSLDQPTADAMMSLFAGLAARRPMGCVIVTHTPAEVARLATRVLHLSGRPATVHAMPVRSGDAGGGLLA
ncbi:NitT/TauT family transport system ATP-binding protein [Loktanella fryxellensis]|uniref:NitT/TauT family transport system ATP-binding protein n=1 Tax=Loktanella fryxellensis TaxID=245187 RepID=A0A1H8JJC3_9RHOB|nr:ATP-binding cassette domain-containing protein [Loktanella fryxellensis]SEN80328.1 NitT/TauT family transport system ATP-binding protein [Loktanella fryxellensis]